MLGAIHLEPLSQDCRIRLSGAPPNSDPQFNQSTSELSPLSKWYCRTVYLTPVVAILADSASYARTIAPYNDRICMWELPY